MPAVLVAVLVVDWWLYWLLIGCWQVKKKDRTADYEKPKYLDRLLGVYHKLYASEGQLNCSIAPTPTITHERFYRYCDVLCAIVCCAVYCRMMCCVLLYIV